MNRQLLVTLLVVIGGCSAQPGNDAAEYVLMEGVIDGPNRLKGPGPTTIQAANSGEFSHTLVVTDDHGEVMGATGLVDPGGEATLEIDLEAGTYVFSCRIVSEDDEGNLIDHYEQGMHRTVTVTG